LWLVPICPDHRRRARRWQRQTVCLSLAMP